MVYTKNMLKQYTITNIFGKEILLFGTFHREYSNSYEPEKTELYNCLENFSPKCIMLEMTKSQNIDKFSDMYTDVNTIQSYINNTDVEYCKYDIPTDDKFEVMSGCILSEDLIQPENIDKVLESRYELSDESSITFKNIVQKREESAANHIINKVSSKNKVAIHCGYNHYPSIKSYINFLTHIN